MADNGAVVGLAEDGGAGDEGVRAGGGGLGDVGGFDAAVHFQCDTPSALRFVCVEQGAGLAQLGEGVRDEVLAAEAGVDRHQQYHVEAVEHVFQNGHGGGGVEHQPGLAAAFADEGEAAVGVAAGFGVEGDDVRARVGEGGDEAVHRFDHQVHVHRYGGVGLDGGAHHRAEGEVGHVMVVHHVKMDQIRARLDNAGNFLAQAGEIGGQNAGSDTEFLHGMLSAALRDARFIPNGIKIKVIAFLQHKIPRGGG